MKKNNNGKGVTTPDYDRAIEYALGRLRNELPATLSYHCAEHTEHDVLPAARRLAERAGVDLEDQRLLEIGAAFHDLGHIYNSARHEAIGVDLINEVLPQYGFAPEAVGRVAAMILATRMPQSPNTLLEQLLADADLDSLGREDFLETSKALWKERAALGIPHSWPEWLEVQLLFLRSHRYFTDVARALRDDGKRRNIQMLEELVRSTR